MLKYPQFIIMHASQTLPNDFVTGAVGRVAIAKVLFPRNQGHEVNPDLLGSLLILSPDSKEG